MVYENKFIIDQLKIFLNKLFNLYNSSSLLTLDINDLSIKSNLVDFKDLQEPIKSILQIIFSTAKSCEDKYADGYFLFLYKLHSFLNKNYINSVSYDKNFISFFDIKNNIIDHYNNLDSSLKEAIQYILLNMDRNSRISIEKSINNNYIIRFSDGFKFSCKQENLLFKNKILNNPYILIIDGYIESISEINILLESASKNKDEILIICRGANNDVINTINLNLKRNTLNVNLCIIPFNENTLNTLKDIAICSGSEHNLISIDKGNTVRSINDYKKFSKIDKIIFDNESFIIINDSNINKNSLKNHIEYIEDRCKEYIRDNNITLLEIFLSRLTSLNSRQTTIMIPESNNQDLEIKLINNIIKKASEILKFGAVEINNRFYSSKCDSYTSENLDFIIKYINNISFILT